MERGLGRGWLDGSSARIALLKPGTEALLSPGVFCIRAHPPFLRKSPTHPRIPLKDVRNILQSLYYDAEGRKVDRPMTPSAQVTEESKEGLSSLEHPKGRPYANSHAFALRSHEWKFCNVHLKFLRHIGGSGSTRLIDTSLVTLNLTKRGK